MKTKSCNDGTGVGVVREQGMKTLQTHSTQGVIIVLTIHSHITEK